MVGGDLANELIVSLGRTNSYSRIFRHLLIGFHLDKLPRDSIADILLLPDSHPRFLLDNEEDFVLLVYFIVCLQGGSGLQGV